MRRRPTSSMLRIAKHVTKLSNSNFPLGKKNAFYVLDKAVLHTNHQKWLQHLPRIKPHYAIKCNNDPAILQTLGKYEGVGFDCASPNEMKDALTYGNVASDQLLYAHPIKEEHNLLEARKMGVNRMTADSCEEIVKIATLHPEAEVMIRIRVDESSARCKLGSKFGASMDEVPNILRAAALHAVNITGIAFHAGSGQRRPQAFSDAVHLARSAFDMGHDHGFKTSMKILNVGGGFVDDTGFEDVANALNSAINQCFGTTTGANAEDGVSVIAEPGRFYVQECLTLATCVIGRKERSNGKVQLFINDSIYGSFNNIMFDHAKVHPEAIMSQCGTDLKYCNTSSDHVGGSVTVCGQTCDGLDIICEQTSLARNVAVNDFLIFPSMGAYTSAAWSHFNGFERPEVLVVESEGDRIEKGVARNHVEREMEM